MKTPLEQWIAERTRLDPLTRETLARYQLERLRQTVSWARRNSSVYAQRLESTAEEDIQTLADVRRLPFTSAQDLRENPAGFVCVSHSEISRIISLITSGTTGAAKRVYFTAQEQEDAIDFFQHALAVFAGSDDRILIVLPGERTGSAGDLLATAVRRLGATPIPYGNVSDPLHAVQVASETRATSIIGVPSDLLGMSRCNGPRLHLRSAALCSDYVPQSVVQALEHAWKCRMFEHYGSTEMGLAGGVNCDGQCGYHMREADLYIEIVDPQTGAPLLDGHTGEVVFTTLTRRGMPLIRYRTGDISRRLTERCPCGSILPRLERVQGRVGGSVRLGSREEISMPQLEERLYTLPWLMHFTATIVRARRDRLVIMTRLAASAPADWEYILRDALLGVPPISRTVHAGELQIVGCRGTAQTPAGEKRRIQCPA